MLADMLFLTAEFTFILAIINLVRKLMLIIKKVREVDMKIKEQIELYVLSLMFLFCMIFFMSIDTLPCEDTSVCKNYEPLDYLYANWLPVLMIIALGYCEKIRRSFEYILEGNSGDSLTIEECKSESYEHLTFLATYIIPFLGFNFESIFRLIAYFMLFVIIGIIYVKTDMYFANPTLAVFGYKLYKVTLSDSENRYESITVLTKNNLEVGQNVSYQFISNSVCFVRKVNNG